MVLIVSRFRVVNGKQDEVREAFLNRPHRVENAPGFLGLEVFTDRHDPCWFHLLTRWESEEDFRRWHSSEAHRESHHTIPRGLKLDPAFTQVLTLDPLAKGAAAPAAAYLSWMSAPLAGLLESSRAVHFFLLSAEGRVTHCNPAAELYLQVPGKCITGHKIGDFLTAPDAETLTASLGKLQPGQTERRLLNFVNAQGSPYSLDCTLTAGPAFFSLLGETLVETERQLNEELLQLNNQVAVLARESARQKKELAQANAALEKALHDLQTSYWHIRRIEEVLPICMECGKVKGTESTWEEVAQYLRKNFPMLSHGYCPDCFDRLMKALDQEEARSTE